MRTFLLISIMVCIHQITYCQNIGISSNGAIPHASAMLDISDTSKGILIPRMSTAQRTAITAPAKGLMVFDNTSNNFWFYNGTAWSQLGGTIVSSNNGWNLSGNGGTKADSNFIGTTDTQSLRIRVNNSWAGAIHPANGNLFLGMDAGKNTSNGSFNTGIGNDALAANTTGLYNAAFGSNALLSNTSGGSNVAMGAGAMYSNTTGLFNTAVGSTALYYGKTGNNNTAMGAETLYSDTSGNNNTAVGYHALTASNGDENTAVGYNSLLANTRGIMNTAVGGRTLRGNTSGNYNTAIGLAALASNTTGFGNTAAGADAMDFNTTGNNNTANGQSSLQYNTTGNYNIAIGFQSMQFNRTGSDNIGIGTNALSANSGGTKNIAIGFGAGTAFYAANTFNTISIGNDDYLNGYQNQVIIGNTSTGWIGGKVTWSTFSDARIKNTIAEDVKGLDFILKLRPVTYHISNKAIVQLSGNKETRDFPGKYDNEKIKYSGFLAQEVETAAKQSHYDFSGYAAPKNEHQLYTLSYEQFVVPLVKAMQEQQKMIADLQLQLNTITTVHPGTGQQLIIDKQQQQILLLEKRLTALEKK